MANRRHPDKVFVGLYVPRALKESLLALARREGKPLSELVAAALAQRVHRAKDQEKRSARAPKLRRQRLAALPPAAADAWNALDPWLL